METALVGLLGVLLGLFITEYFRKRSRVEMYSKEVFEKRLGIYETLYEKIDKSFRTAIDIIENPNYSKAERHAIWSDVVLDVAAFTDANALYLNENLVVHCLTTLIAVEDIHGIKNQEEKEFEKNRFFENNAKSKRMIKKEAGLEALDKLFGTISKAKHKSAYIDYYKNAKKRLKAGK